MSFKRFLQGIAFIILSLNTLDAFSQAFTEDSTIIKNDTIPANWKDEKDSIEVFYYLANINQLKLGNLIHIDTTITRTHQYDKLYHNNKLYSTLSNIGLAHISLNFHPDLQQGFSKSLFYFNQYLITNDEVKYYKLSKPYTELFYVTGARKEQILQAVFSRDIYKGLNIGINLNFENSPGTYKNTKTNNVTGYFNLQYVSPNDRYHVIGNFLMNKLKLHENGGLVDDKYFTDNLEHDRRVIPINLATAYNEIRESGFYLQQQFNLTSAKKIKDTSRNIIDMGSINYSFQYKRNIYTFSDKNPLAEFYQSYSAPIDSSATFDSTTQIFVKNQIGWSSLGYGKKREESPFYLFGNLNYEHISEQLPYDSIKTSWDQVSISGGTGINIKKSFYLKSTGYLYFTGYNQGDFGIKANINQYLGNKDKNFGELILELDFYSKTPWRFYQKWNSNRFRWTNNFDKESYLIFAGKYKYKFLDAGINFYTIGNFTYLNDSIKPAQAEKVLTVTQFYAQSLLIYGKLGVDTKLVYQYASQPEIIRIPEFTATLNVFYRSPVFNNAATLQTGVQFRYFTKYYAYGYFPELRAFYTQNEVETGDYIWADIYLTMKIQRARLFFKMVNVTGYFEGYNYFLAPHYPDRDARFYFGVSWRFHD